MKLICFITVGLLVIGVKSVPTHTDRMKISQIRTSDLESSATNYIYQQRKHSPVSYIQYASHGYGPNVYADYDHYDVDGLEALAPYYSIIHHYEEPHHLYNYHDEHWYNNSYNDHEDPKGTEFQDKINSVHEELGVKGFGTHYNFDRGENEHRDVDHHHGEYKDEVEYEGNQEKSNSKYDAFDEVEAVQEGAKYDKKTYQKKGHRTSGFHNVYRKDEYKKNTDFYDEDHDDGHYKNYGINNAHYKNEAAVYEKGAKHDSADDLKIHGQKGYYDNGNEHKLHKSHENVKEEDTIREI